MKSSRMVLAACLLAVVAVAPASLVAQEAAGERMSKEDLLAYLAETRQNFLESIEGLTEEQWRFKPAADRWSVGEVAEHIAISERFLLDIIRNRVLENEKATERPEGPRVSDADIVNRITDRSQRAQAPEQGQPTGRFATRAELLQAYEDAHSAVVKAARESGEEVLRGRYTASPVGVLDGHQFLLFLAAHTARHTLQIEEVKEHAGFPE
jgi:hypothetical protein